MTFKIHNNTGMSGDTMVHDEDTADRIVPGGLPVKNIFISVEANEPVKVFFELDFMGIDLRGLQNFGVRMRVPGTERIAEVAEIRYKDGSVYRCP